MLNSQQMGLPENNAMCCHPGPPDLGTSSPLPGKSSLWLKIPNPSPQPTWCWLSPLKCLNGRSQREGEHCHLTRLLGHLPFDKQWPHPSLQDPTTSLTLGWHPRRDWQVRKHAQWQEEVKYPLGNTSKGSCPRAPGPGFSEHKKDTMVTMLSTEWGHEVTGSCPLLSGHWLQGDGAGMRKYLHQSFPLWRAEKLALPGPAIYSCGLNSAIRCVHKVGSFCLFDELSC